MVFIVLNVEICVLYNVNWLANVNVEGPELIFTLFYVHRNKKSSLLTIENS